MVNINNMINGLYHNNSKLMTKYWYQKKMYQAFFILTIRIYIIACCHVNAIDVPLNSVTVLESTVQLLLLQYVNVLCLSFYR